VVAIGTSTVMLGLKIGYLCIWYNLVKKAIVTNLCNKYIHFSVGTSTFLLKLNNVLHVSTISLHLQTCSIISICKCKKCPCLINVGEK
jgi:hypothetical protein